MTEETTELLTFPCQFPIKAMGRHDGEFAALITAIVSRHSGPVADHQVQVNASNGGRFLAVTVTIEAESRAQLDAIYMDLTAHEAVLMAL
ncbi:MAG: DUF493 domain-containing protein [Wenzhouxiangellaceae bacterium]